MRGLLATGTLASLLTLLACALPADKTVNTGRNEARPPSRTAAETTHGPAADEVVLKETAKTRIGGVSVGMGNMWERTYLKADGVEHYGLAARLYPDDDEPIDVGLDSEVRIANRRWKVVAIEKERGSLGSLRLEALD